MKQLFSGSGAGRRSARLPSDRKAPPGHQSPPPQQPQPMQPPQQARDPHVVVGIAAAMEDEVEDWTEDFVDSRKSGAGRAASAPPTTTTGDHVSALLSSARISSATSTTRPALRWHRQLSLDSSSYADAPISSSSASRLRKSSGDLATAAGDAPTLFQQQQRERHSDGATPERTITTMTPTSSVAALAEDVTSDPSDTENDISGAPPTTTTATVTFQLDTDREEDEEEKEEEKDDEDEDEDEDWDVEFGFAETSEDDPTDAAGSMDPTRRRSENFNIFLRNFHDMMDGDHLSDDSDDDDNDSKADSPTTDQSPRPGRSTTKRASKPAEEKLFQRQRSHVPPHPHSLHASPSVDESVDGTSRASLTSATGTAAASPTEYVLADKYRLLDVASSAAYAVRIERYPKPCATYSNLEKDAAGRFAGFTEPTFERWLASLTATKCARALAALDHEREQMATPRQQKNHQFRTMVSLPFGRAFVASCFRQVALYRYVGEDKSNRELVRVYFEKVSTTAYADEPDWASAWSADDVAYVANCTMEILQEAARLYGPTPTPASASSSLSFSSASPPPASSNATLFWMRQFQSILRICVEAFPTYRHVIALIELRYVCHHLVGFTPSDDFTHTWQVCNQLPAFCPTELLAGEAAPNVANEILEFYGALFVHLNTSTETRSSFHSELSATELGSVSFGLSPDVICLQALLLCDIQSLYDSRSVLAEVPIPELAELFEFEEDDMNIDPRIMELLDTEAKVQSHVPGLYTDARTSSDPSLSSSSTRRPSSGGLGGWSTEARLVALLKPSCHVRLPALGFFYERISVHAHPLVKAKCAFVLASMHVAVGSLPNVRVAESLAYEAVRVLEACSATKLDVTQPSTSTSDTLTLSMFRNDGLLSELGREALEQLGDVLIKNQKYRYGVLVLEAASDVFAFLNHGCAYEKMDRLLCRLTLEADDVRRALPLHEKVALSAQRQGNLTEYIYLTQALTNLWVKEGAFARAEHNLLTAFRVLRDHTGVLPPSILTFLHAAASDTPTTASSGTRSGTMMTTSSTASSSLSNASFHGPSSSSRSHMTSELDAWLTHDLTLHLLVRDVYRASGRDVEGVHVLQYVLSYSSRLPRGKRTQLQMLLAEDALQLGLLDTCRYLFAFLDREANLFCERLKENILSSTIGSSSGGNGGGGGSSSSGGRSFTGLGSEARYCFDMVFSLRYVVCRAKFALQTNAFRDAFSWLSLAHVKSDKQNRRRQAQLHVLDARVLFGLFREFYEHRRTETTGATSPAAIAAEVASVVLAFGGSFYGLTTMEKRTLETRLALFCECARSSTHAREHGVQLLWTAVDAYASLDDARHQLKALLEIVAFQLAPIAHAFFALGSSQDDDELQSLLFRTSSGRMNDTTGTAGGRRGSDRDAADADDVIERTRRTVLDAQKLLRRALALAEQVADPASLLQTLVWSSEVWVWLERLASYKNDKVVKEAAALWDEAVKLLNAVFLRRVAFHIVADGQSRDNAPLRTTFSVVPILNFRERVIATLERTTLRLIFVACQLQQFARVPEYIEELVGVHLDELLSAKLGLSTIAHQLAAFRELQRVPRRAPASAAASLGGTTLSATPRGSGMSATGSDSSGPRSASFTSSNSTPGTSTSSATATATAAMKRKGHKKNQSMSSISELLASSGSSNGPSASFHDVSSSFGGPTRGGSFLGTASTPRTGLASLSDRVAGSHSSSTAVIPAIHSPLLVRPRRGHYGFERTPLRARGRSSSAPQSTPPGSLKLDVPVGAEPHELLAPVHESAESLPTRRIVDLADVSASWGQDELRAIGDGHDHDGMRGEASSSGGVVGLYDFDEGQSEKLWWIFNTWRDTKAKFASGKIETTAVRTQNLRSLRTLLDTFDPHQVAVLYVGGSTASTTTTTGTPPLCGIVGFDVAHINSHALIQKNDLVLSIRYDVDKDASAASPYGYAPLQFKVFRVVDGETAQWRAEIPRPEWYLKHHALVEAETGSPGAGALRALRLLGPKVLVKVLGLLLLENAVVVTGASFPHVQEVALSLLALLQPFQWHHTFLPFLPTPSWRFLFDAMQQFAHAQLATLPKSRKSFSRLSTEWRWGGYSSSAPSSSSSAFPSVATPVDSDDPPFLIGTTTEAWQTCLKHARSRGDDTARAILSYVTVVDLDHVDAFAIAKSNTNAVPLPRKWRKHFLERFDKAAKQRRKVQLKVGRRLARQPTTPGGRSTTSTVHSPYGSDGTFRPLDALHRSYDDVRSSSRSASALWMGQGEAGLDAGSQYFVSAVVAAEAGSSSSDDRRFFDHECLAAFLSGLHELYDKLQSVCEEKELKLQGGTKKKKKAGSGLSKRQELKAWFSSSHDFDAFADKFQDAAMFVQRVKTPAGAGETRTTGAALLSVGSSSSNGPRSLGSRISHQLRSASSMSSTSSNGVGLGL